MLQMFEQLRNQMVTDVSVAEIDDKMRQQLAHHFIYGVALFCFLRQKKVICFNQYQNEKLKSLQKIKRIKFILRYLQRHYIRYICVGISEYDVEDYTIYFGANTLISVAKEIVKLDYNLECDAFWHIQEEFFISSF